VHPSASISAGISIEMLKQADQIPAGCKQITLLAGRDPRSAEGLSWFAVQPRWTSMMHLTHGHDRLVKKGQL
jgi:hypothetical protein